LDVRESRNDITIAGAIVETNAEWCYSSRGIVLDGQWITTSDGPWRNNVKSARDGGEEGEGREHSELHDGREEGAVVLERERRGGNGAFESIYVKRKRRELASFRQQAK